ncbi:hypothetical protein BDW71DRAFT_202534 [Aspergillus fruticulosus]
MPHFHHKRRHSWPYCGSTKDLSERNLPIITVTGPADEFEGQFLTPVEPNELFEDDAASAGIVRTQPTYSHRLWHHSKDRSEANRTSAGTVSLQSETNRLAYLSTHTSNSPNMSRPKTPRSYPSAIDTSISRDSFSSTESPSPLQSSPRRTGSSKSRASSDSRRRYDNTVYHYGRHSNYWLFGGFSVRDTVRDGVDWIRQQKKG